MPVPRFADIFADDDRNTIHYDALPEMEAQRRDAAAATAEHPDDPIDIGHLIDAALQ